MKAALYFLAVYGAIALFGDLDWPALLGLAGLAMVWILR